jgi:ATP synthase protein I
MMSGIAKAIALQLFVTLVVAMVAAMVGGAHAAASAALGGMACVVPNALFAWRLSIEMRRPGGATVQGFFVGEFVKLAATVVLLFVIASVVRDLNWLALLVGFVAALKSYFLMFLFGQRLA